MEKKCYFTIFSFQQFNFEDVRYTIYPPGHPDFPVVDIPLNIIFQCFTPDQVLRLVTCMLLQQRMVFLSSSYALLTVVMYVRIIISFISCTYILIKKPWSFD